MSPRPLLPLLCLLVQALVANAQLRNGQFFTPGLVIIDSPSQPTPFSVGSTLPIALDISGDGLLPFPVPQITNSTPPTAILSLSLFLVSKDTNTNISVSSNGTLLQQEPSSTVKHLSYYIPTCIASGAYNLTFYELDRINNETFFSIYEIPLALYNPASDEPQIYKDQNRGCENSTKLFNISQAQNRPPVQPFVSNGKEGTSLATANPTPSYEVSSWYTMSAPGGNGGEITVYRSGGITYLSGQGFTTIRTAIAVPTVEVVPVITTVNGQPQATSVKVSTTELEPFIIAIPTGVGGSMSGAGEIVSVGAFGVPLDDAASAAPRVASMAAVVAGALCGWMLVGG